MNRQEIMTSASALSNLLRAGIPINQALGRVGILQPKHREFWIDARRAVERGERVSESLRDIWPDTLVAAVRAGEKAGKLTEIFAEIERTLETETAVLKLMRKLLYPISLVITGFIVFCGFMAFVLPGIGKSIAEKNRGAVFQIASGFEHVLTNYWWAVLIAIGGASYSAYSWLSKPQGRQELLNHILKIPGLHQTIRDLYFALWANQMALMTGAGIGTVSALEATAGSLPLRFQDAVLALKFEIGLKNRNLADSIDPEKLDPDDPRTEFPFYITNAFMVAEQTGEIDKELNRVAPALLNDGMKGMSRALEFANIGATILAAIFIVSPLAVYYTQVFSGLNTL